MEGGLEERGARRRDNNTIQNWKEKIRTCIEEFVKDPPSLLQSIGGRHVLVLGGVLF